GQYDESRSMIEAALQQYPKDALVPKFALLNAFNSGKTVGKEIMILQLEQIALNYSKTLEGAKAEEMLKYLRSDLTLEMTDEMGNKSNPLPTGTVPDQPAEDRPAQVQPQGFPRAPGNSETRTPRKPRSGNISQPTIMNPPQDALIK